MFTNKMKTSCTGVQVSLKKVYLPLFSIIVLTMVFSFFQNCQSISPSLPSTQESLNLTYSKIDVDNEGHPFKTAFNGRFDPSITYDDAGIGWMVYSSVGGGRDPFGPYIQTELAKSNDNGKTWAWVQTINPAYDDSFNPPNGPLLEGNWNYEVSTITYSPSDPVNKWKILSHKLFAPQDTGHNDPRYSWIIYKEAPTPNGPWSAERALFKADFAPLEPFNDVPEINLNDLYQGSEDIVAYSEPGLIDFNGKLYLNITALSADGPSKILLLNSEDHGQNWNFIGVLTDIEDAEKLGYRALDGSALVIGKNNVIYFLIAPILEGSTFVHDGTLVVKVLDINQANLSRDSNGKLIVERHIFANPDIFSGNGAGQSTYHYKNINGGLIMSQMHIDNHPEVFKIFNTKINF